MLLYSPSWSCRHAHLAKWYLTSVRPCKLPAPCKHQMPCNSNFKQLCINTYVGCRKHTQAAQTAQTAMWCWG